MGSSSTRWILRTGFWWSTGHPIGGEVRLVGWKMKRWHVWWKGQVLGERSAAMVCVGRGKQGQGQGREKQQQARVQSDSEQGSVMYGHSTWEGKDGSSGC